MVQLVTSEFIQQGDMEREKFHENDIPVSLRNSDVQVELNFAKVTFDPVTSVF